MQAAFLRVKLTVLDEWNARRRKIADQYSELLANTNIVLPYVPEYAEPIWHLYVIRCKYRNALKEYLEKHGISTIIHYPIPPHQQACYHAFNSHNLPIAELLAKEVLSLPMSPTISIAELEYVVGKLFDFQCNGDYLK